MSVSLMHNVYNSPKLYYLHITCWKIPHIKSRLYSEMKSFKHPSVKN